MKENVSGCFFLNTVYNNHRTCNRAYSFYFGSDHTSDGVSR